MNDVLKIFLSLSLSGSLIILILFLCKHFWKDKISRQWQYYIWLIVIVRLLFPFAPETNLMGSIFQAATVLQQQEQDTLQSIENTISPNMEHNGQGKSKLSIQPTSSQPIQDITTLLENNIWLVWLTIAFGLLIRKITIYQSFVCYIKARQILVSDVGLLDRLSVLVGQAGIKKPVELCVNPLISSPLLVGFFRPYIVLPSTDISEKDFRYTVLHELTHYRRRDMFYKWLVQGTVCLHWFNPLVYIMSREINNACEFSCDEAIIAMLDYSNVQEYGKTLLDTMVKAGNYKESLASVTLNENKEILKERLGSIMSFKKKSKLCLAVTIVLTISLCFGATVSGAAVSSRHANEDNNSPFTSNVDIKSNRVISQSYQAGEIISFGKFNNQSLKWKILKIKNEDKALLFATDTLDTLLPFDKTSNIWENSFIRSWLNSTKQGKFLTENNFTQEERHAIIKTKISTGILGNATKDYVFLISKDEYYKYDIGNVSYDINSFWTRTGEPNSGSNVVLFASYHQVNGSFNASEKGGIRPMLWVDLDLLSSKGNSGIENHVNQQNDIVAPNGNAKSLSIAIQSTDNLISSILGRKYMVYGPFDGNSIESVTCKLNNKVKARLEMVLSGQNKTVDGVEITNSIGFGKSYTNTLHVSKKLLNSNKQFYVFIGSDNIKNLTGTISFSSGQN